MKRPAFQFYPADWRNNAKLRRCSEAARGVWMDVLCVLHDSDEYGVCRWPLVDLARAAGANLKLVKELAQKDVLKGSDKNTAPYVYTPRHAGKNGDPVTLVDTDGGPCWYSSRFVRDEWVRLRRGSTTQFSSENQPPKIEPKTPPKPKPKGGIGDRQGDGPTSSSSSTSIGIPTLVAKDGDSGNRHRDDERPNSPAEWIEVFADQHGVDVDHRSFHDRKKFWPLAQAWTNAGITVGQMREACAKAHAESTEAIAWLPAYADRVLATMNAPKRAAEPAPEWEVDARKRMQIAVPLLAKKDHSNPEIFDMEAKNVTAIGMG